MCAVLGNMPINHSGRSIPLHTNLLLLLAVLLTRAIIQPVYLQRDVRSVSIRGLVSIFTTLLACLCSRRLNTS